MKIFDHHKFFFINCFRFFIDKDINHNKYYFTAKAYSERQEKLKDATEESIIIKIVDVHVQGNSFIAQHFAASAHKATDEAAADEDEE